MSSIFGYSSMDSFAFFCDEVGGLNCGGFGGSITAPVAPDSGDIHIPFNSFKDLSFKLPKYATYEAVYMGNRYKTRQSKILELGEMTLTTVYHAPFLLARVFSTATTVSAGWTSTASVVNMNFGSYETTTDSIMSHIHINNRSSTLADLDINLFGGFVTEYKWTIDASSEGGGILDEGVTLSFSHTTTSAIAMNTAATYHNSKFAKWNHNYITTDDEVQAIAQNKVSVTTTTALDAAISAMTKATFTIKTDRSSMVGLGYESTNFMAKKAPDVLCELSIVPKDSHMINEQLSRIENRDLIHFQMKITTDVDRYEYLQCTNMRLDSIEEIKIPEASEDANLSFDLKFLASADSVLSYKGVFDASTTSTPVSYIKGL